MIKLILKKRFEWPGVRLCLITGKHFATKISKSFIPKSTSSITPCHICPSLPILALSLLPSTDYKIWMARCAAVSHHREAFWYLDEYILQLGQIHFVIWTNIFKMIFEWPGVRLCLITGKRFATLVVSRAPTLVQSSHYDPSHRNITIVVISSRGSQICHWVVVHQL